MIPLVPHTYYNTKMYQLIYQHLHTLLCCTVNLNDFGLDLNDSGPKVIRNGDNLGVAILFLCCQLSTQTSHWCFLMLADKIAYQYDYGDIHGQ